MNKVAIKNLLTPGAYGEFADCDNFGIVVTDDGLTIEASVGDKTASRVIENASLDDNSYKSKFRPLCESMRTELDVKAKIYK
jgi:arginine decarboxylase-like protein